MFEKNERLLEVACSIPRATTTNSILDSKHISPTIYNNTNKKYDIKLVECGDFIQLYLYETKKIRKTKDKDFDLELKKQKINNMFDSVADNTIKESQKFSNEIEQRSIIRSKLECQRLAKANVKDWETFITLTFEENVSDVSSANKRFRYFVDKVRRIKKDFKYICITEFQKRGAIHYHLLTNVSINDKKLMYEQKDNPKFKHIKYWLEGFTSVEIIKGDSKKIVGYISKYMTKDIDNRLFNKHRYFYSQNLIKPQESFIDIENEQENNYYIKKIQDKDLIYQNEYINPYDNTKVTFLEFSNKS